MARKQSKQTKQTYSIANDIYDLLKGIAEVTGMPQSRVVAKGIELYFNTLTPETQEEVHNHLRMLAQESE